MNHISYTGMLVCFGFLLFALTGCEIDRTGDSVSTGGSPNTSGPAGNNTGSGTNAPPSGNNPTPPSGGGSNNDNPFNNPGGTAQINADLFKQGNGTYQYGGQTFNNCDELGFFLLTQSPPINLINCGTANFP